MHGDGACLLRALARHCKSPLAALSSSCSELPRMNADGSTTSSTASRSSQRSGSWTSTWRCFFCFFFIVCRYSCWGFLLCYAMTLSPGILDWASRSGGQDSVGGLPPTSAVRIHTAMTGRPGGASIMLCHSRCRPRLQSRPRSRRGGCRSRSVTGGRAGGRWPVDVREAGRRRPTAPRSRAMGRGGRGRVCPSIDGGHGTRPQKQWRKKQPRATSVPPLRRRCGNTAARAAESRAPSQPDRYGRPSVRRHRAGSRTQQQYIQHRSLVQAATRQTPTLGQVSHGFADVHIIHSGVRAPYSSLACPRGTGPALLSTYVHS